ncbi:MAG TPA: nucleotide-binding protein [Candidatus Dormibacteraeota bacterium]|jgi:predicted nucleotide-binding protein|nr:nucleotide-binding protein [Candidatus Dormibacteraeota bacterium]
MTLEGLNAQIVAAVDEWERTRTDNYLLGIDDLEARLAGDSPHGEVRIAVDRLDRTGYLKLNRTQTSMAVERLGPRGIEEVETMARARTRADNADPEPQLVKPIDDARSSLQEQVRLGGEMIAETSSAAAATADGLRQLKEKKYSWGDYNEQLLRSLFRPSDRILSEYSGGPFFGTLGGAPEPLHVQAAELRDDVQRDVRRLNSIIERLPLFESNVTPALPPAVAGAVQQRVFIVHGRNDTVRLDVARFLESGATNFEVKILTETINRGRTIIEKFEDEAGSSTFAVVLLTADDEGGPRSAPERHPRARQNVILELGYFIGRLRRDKVAILYEPGVELPSDVDGVAYIELDQNGGWRGKLARELRGADHILDLNKAN